MLRVRVFLFGFLFATLFTHCAGIPFPTISIWSKKGGPVAALEISRADGLGIQTTVCGLYPFRIQSRTTVFYRHSHLIQNVGGSFLPHLGSASHVHLMPGFCRGVENLLIKKMTIFFWISQPAAEILVTREIRRIFVLKPKVGKWQFSGRLLFKINAFQKLFQNFAYVGANQLIHRFFFCSSHLIKGSLYEKVPMEMKGYKKSFQHAE